MKDRFKNEIQIYQSEDNKTEIKVRFKEDTVWLTQAQIASLFAKDRTTINRHISNIFEDGELKEKEVCADFAHTTKHGAIKGKKQTRKLKYYNLDMVISVGYRVNSKIGIQFRKWATKRLKDYLIKGYSINKKRLEQKKQQVRYLKTGIQIMSRALEHKSKIEDSELLHIFARGLDLLDKYDNAELDKKGKTKKETIYPSYEDYMNFISEMYTEFGKGIFGQPKDESFRSSINMIKQTFDGKELYPTIQEKATNLLYSIVKNHSFVDGNKRIGAACFLYFLDQNGILFSNNKEPIINNDTLASLTLFIANSKREEAAIVKQLVISILNGDKF